MLFHALDMHVLQSGEFITCLSQKAVITTTLQAKLREKKQHSSTLLLKMSHY